MTDERIETEAALEPRARPANFALAAVAGIGAAVVGAILWAVFTYATNYELGLIAVAIGALVGIAVRKAGNGDTANFAILGALCAALGCALGIVLCDIAVYASVTGGSFLDAFSTLGIGGSLSLAGEAADPMDLLFVAIAIYEGFKFSIHKEAPDAG
jgi:hypothetical protein